MFALLYLSFKVMWELLEWTIKLSILMIFLTIWGFQALFYLTGNLLMLFSASTRPRAFRRHAPRMLRLPL